MRSVIFRHTEEGIGEIVAYQEYLEICEGGYRTLTPSLKSWGGVFHGFYSGPRIDKKEDIGKYFKGFTGDVFPAGSDTLFIGSGPLKKDGKDVL